MSTWYYYVNLTKKEYFSSLDIGYSLKIYPYITNLLPLIGFLHVKYYNTSQDCNDRDHTPEDEEDTVLHGHWAGDECEFVMEQTEVYDEIVEDEDKKDNRKWINISHQLLEEYNKHLKMYSEFWLDEEERQRLSIPVGSFGFRKHN